MHPPAARACPFFRFHHNDTSRPSGRLASFPYRTLPRHRPPLPPSMPHDVSVPAPVPLPIRQPRQPRKPHRSPSLRFVIPKTVLTRRMGPIHSDRYPPMRRHPSLPMSTTAFHPQDSHRLPPPHAGHLPRPLSTAPSCRPAQSGQCNPPHANSGNSPEASILRPARHTPSRPNSVRRFISRAVLPRRRPIRPVTEAGA